MHKTLCIPKPRIPAGAEHEVQGGEVIRAWVRRESGPAVLLQNDEHTASIVAERRDKSMQTLVAENGWSVADLPVKGGGTPPSWLT